MKLKKSALLLTLLIPMTAALASCGKSGGDELDETGKLKVSLRNLYFDTWAGGDAYVDFIQDKFQLAIEPSNYSWANWGEQVSSAVNADNLTDVFHFDLESFNFGNTYEFWAKGGVTKALPEDMSKWPNIQKMLSQTSNLESLKLGGKLYGLPISYNIDKPEKDYSSFTYVYRRDWAKECGVYQENDVYTWDQFLKVVQAFDSMHESEDYYALADVEWGFPSIANFYKDVPHCYIKGESGKVENAFLSPSYIEGLEKTKDFVTKRYYGYDQYSATDGSTYKEFKAGRCGIYYENLSLSNYITLRKDVKANQKFANVDDATAIMKVKGPDGKYALEATDNWFSMTFFNGDMSDEKMERLLDLMDWLISEEGTRFATYGIEGYDYTVQDGKIVLSETGWEKDEEGEYIPKINGGKFLRYMVTLGNDTQAYDPMIDKVSYDIIHDWMTEMDEAKASSSLRIISEDPKIKWLSTPKKNEHTSGLLKGANDDVVKYAYNKYTTIDQYRSSMVNNPNWTATLAEINERLGY